MFLYSVCHASDGKSAGYILTRATSGRAAALADSFGSIDNDVAGVKYNPGCLATISRTQLSVMYNKGSVEDTFRNVTLGASGGSGNIACSVDYYDAGTLEFYDSSWEKQTVAAERDIVAALSYGRTIRFSGSPIYSGVTLKYIQSTLVEYKTASAYAMDAGFLCPFFSLPVMVGVSARNIGTKLKYLDTGDPLPSSVMVSARFRARQFFIVTDAGYFLNDKIRTQSVGMEYLIKNTIFLRCGYRFNSDIEKLCCGVGIKLQNLTFNYALKLDNTLGNNQMISVDILFPRHRRASSKKD